MVKKYVNWAISSQVLKRERLIDYSERKYTQAGGKGEHLTKDEDIVTAYMKI